MTNINFLKKMIDLVEASKDLSNDELTKKVIDVCKEEGELESIIEINQKILDDSSTSDRMKEMAKLFLDNVSKQNKSSPTNKDNFESIPEEIKSLLGSMWYDVEDFTLLKLKEKDLSFISKYLFIDNESKFNPVVINYEWDNIISDNDWFFWFDKDIDVSKLKTAKVELINWTKEYLIERLKNSRVFAYESVIDSCKDSPEDVAINLNLVLKVEEDWIFWVHFAQLDDSMQFKTKWHPFKQMLDTKEWFYIVS